MWTSLSCRDTYVAGEGNSHPFKTKRLKTQALMHKLLHMVLFKDSSDSAEARQWFNCFSGHFWVYSDTTVFCYPAFFFFFFWQMVQICKKCIYWLWIYHLSVTFVSSCAKWWRLYLSYRVVWESNETKRAKPLIQGLAYKEGHCRRRYYH